jgi:hypothetical protein
LIRWSPSATNNSDKNGAAAKLAAQLSVIPFPLDGSLPAKKAFARLKSRFAKIGMVPVRTKIKNHNRCFVNGSLSAAAD